MAVTQYSVGVILVAVFAAVCCNFWWFIASKHRVHPLFIFYVLTMCVVVTRFYQTIWYFACLFDQQPIGFDAPPTFKCMLGFEQSWIMFELCMRIRATTKTMSEQIAGARQSNRLS